jgi:DNA-binding GntR family transcriptional regulator
VRVEQDQSVELLLALRRDAQTPLVSQIEDQLREAIRAGTLRPGTGLAPPATWHGSSASRAASS